MNRTDAKLIKLFAYEIVNDLHENGPKTERDLWWYSTPTKRQFVTAAVNYLFDSNNVFLNNKNKIELTDKVNKSRGWT